MVRKVLAGVVLVLSVYFQTSVNVPVTQETTCAICDRTNDYHNCPVSQQCPINEVCSIKMSISGSLPVYKLGCEEKTICDRIFKNYRDTHAPVGRENGDIEVCVACCDGLNCNKANCMELRRNQTCFDTTICGP